MSGFLTAWDAEARQPREVPASDAIAIGLPILVWDEEREEHVLVPATGVAMSMLAYAATLPAGSAHRAEAERQALEIRPLYGPRKPKAVSRKSGT